MANSFVRAEDAQEWARLGSEVVRLESLNIDSTKKRYESHKAKLEAELKQLKTQAENHKREAYRSQGKIETLEKRGVSRFLSRVTGTLDDKIAKNQDRTQRNMELHGVKVGEMERCQSELREVTNTLSRVYSDEAALKGLKEQQKNLLLRVFDGPAGAGDSYEKQLQAEVKSLKPELEKNKKRKETHENALKHLRKGTQECAKAVQLLQQASRLCAVDVAMSARRRGGPPGRNPGMGNVMVDRRKHQFLRGAAQTLQGAAAEVLQAKSYVSEIQPIDPNLVRSMSPFIDMMFNSMVTDIVVAKQVKDSLRRTEETYTHLQAGLAWLERNESAVSAKYSAVKAHYEEKKTQLKTHRIRLISSPPPQAPQATLIEGLLPPPAYSVTNPFAQTGNAFDPFAPSAPSAFIPPPSPSFPHYPFVHPSSAPVTPQPSPQAYPKGSGDYSKFPY
eukprot:comp19563_c0_seq1/m.22967 comp19563_c0_seq1/g.22967  ORF comp19563_c0_seq1/g.22967 comp19563_c0_seq1/m.22967 type:complete len:447 (-) comp19563_c0_seq1:346-1686(-)